MGIVFRQSAKTSIVVATGALLGMVVLWLATQYIPDKHQFGFSQNFTNYAVTLSCLLTVGLNYTLSVYIHHYNDAERKRRMLLTICFGWPLVVFGIVTVIYFLVKNWLLRHYQPLDIPLMREFYGWLPLYTALFLYQLLLEQYLGTQMKQALAAFMREVVIRIINIILLFLLALQLISFHTFIVGMVLMYVAAVVVLWMFSSRTKTFKFSLDIHAFTYTEYKELIHFSWYHSLLAFVILFLSLMDMLMIPFYDHNGLADLAIYRISVLLITILQLPSKALLPASFTVIARAFADKDHEKAKNLFARSSTNLQILSVGFAILLCCNLHNVVSVIKNGYEGIVPIFLILLIGRMVDVATGMNDQVLSIAKYYKFNFYLSLVLMLLLFLLIRFSVPRYGLYGAAWSTTLTLIIFNVIKYVFVKKKLGMDPFSKKTLLIAVCGLSAFAAGYFFPHFFPAEHHAYVHSFIDAVLRSTIIVIVYGVMLLWLKPSPDLEEYIGIIKKEKRLF